MSGRPLRIALVQTQAENAGAQEISRLVAAGLEARGHEVRQIFFFRRTASFDEVDNARVICAERPSSPGRFLAFVARLRAALRELRPDAVLTFQHYGNIIGAPVARWAGCGTVVASQVSAGEMLSPALVWIDAALGSLGFYSRVVTNSIETENRYRRYWQPYSRRLVRIDHGFDDKTVALPPREARQLFNLPREVTLAGCVARLSPLKQLDCAIRLLAVRPSLHLALVGQGSDRDRLERLAATLGVADRVHFVGELDPSDIGPFLAGLDVFLHPSASETFGLAPVEAAQAGVPVVCNDLEVLRDVLQVEGRPCALFTRVEDTEAFAAALDRVLTEPGLADGLRDVGRRLSERYPVDAMVDEYLGLIAQLLGETSLCGSPSPSTAVPSGAGRTISASD